MNVKSRKTKIFILQIFLFFAAFIVLIIFLDYFCYYTYPNTLKSRKSAKDYFSKYVDKTKDENNEQYIYDINTQNKYRKIENPNSNSDSIILFGFSSVYGANLKPNETISHYLGKLSNRTVYNRAKPDASLNHMYYQLSNEDFYKAVKKTKYVIYFYTPKQMIIMNHKMNYCQSDIYYKIQNGKLIRYEKIPLYKKSYLIAAINRFLFYNNILKDYHYKKDSKLFETILTESKKEAQNHWGGDVEFIIVKYGNKNINEEKIFDSLKKEGFIILDYSALQKNTQKTALFWKNASQILINQIPDLK